jgi:ketosteroid isomerase-like protein
MAAVRAVESFIAADNRGDAPGVVAFYSSPVYYEGVSRSHDWLYEDLDTGWSLYPDHQISLTSTPQFVVGPVPDGYGWSGTISYSFRFTGTGTNSGEFVCRNHDATDEVQIDSSGDVNFTSHRTDSTDC